MLAPCELADAAVRQLVFEQVVEPLAPRLPAVGTEDDAVAIRMPGRIAVVVDVVRQRSQLPRGHVGDVQIGQPAPVGAGEHDRIGARRPFGRRYRDDGGKTEPLSFLPPPQVPYDQMVPTVALGREGQEIAVSGHGQATEERVQRFEGGGALAFDDDLGLAAFERTPDDLGIPLGIAVIQHLLAVGRRRPARRWHHARLEVEPRVGERRRHLARWIGTLDGRQNRLVEVVLPALVQIRQRLPRGDLEDLGELLSSPPVLQQPVEDIFAVFTGHELADGLAFLVHLETAGDLVHLGDRRQAMREQGVADDHGGPAVPLTRPVFRQAFGEPQRPRPVLGDAPAAQDMPYEVEHEHVNELVVEDALELGQRAAQGQGNPALEELGEAGDALGQVAGDDVRLLEVDVRGINDQRNSALHGVAESALGMTESGLGHVTGIRSQLRFFRVEVEIEVFGLHLLPLETVVLHLVLAESVQLTVPVAAHREHQRHGQEGGGDGSGAQAAARRRSGGG